jgi:phospholipid transport system substrate-binding protein
MVKRFGLVILVIVLSVTSHGFRDKTAPGDDAAPMAGPAIRPLDVVKSSVSRGLASLRSPRVGFNTGEERRAEIRRAADDLFDVDDIARRALGQHWKGLVPRERDEFVALFRAVLTQSFVTIVQRYPGDHVPSLDEEVAGTFAQVRSRITPEQGQEITIEYRLSRTGSQWAVYDVVLDGASLVSTYRSQFNSIIGTSSAAQLLERMRTEPSRHQTSPDAGTGATIAEPEASARGRLAAGLLLGAASYARWGR